MVHHLDGMFLRSFLELPNLPLTAAQESEMSASMKEVREVVVSAAVQCCLGGSKRYNAVLRKAVDAALCGSAARQCCAAALRRSSAPRRLWRCLRARAAPRARAGRRPPTSAERPTRGRGSL